jgi:hypothetical protein
MRLPLQKMVGIMTSLHSSRRMSFVIGRSPSSAWSRAANTVAGAAASNTATLADRVRPREPPGPPGEIIGVAPSPAVTSSSHSRGQLMDVMGIAIPGHTFRWRL